MNKPNAAYRILKSYTQWMYTKCYCRVFEVHGTENIPNSGATIFISNHQNNLPDALSILFATDRQPVFVARADFFRDPLANSLLRFMRILPMYRADHGRDSIKMELGETMGALADHLRSGGAIAIMGEGSSAQRRDIRPLKKSWSRLAVDMQTEERVIHVIPTVVEYSDWQDWGPDVRVTFGKALELEDKSDLSHSQLVKKLTDTAHERLSEMVANDEEIYAWHQGISKRRKSKTVLWRMIGLFVLPVGLVLFAPVLILAHQRVKMHSRYDFKATLQLGFIGLGVPFWLLLLIVIPGFYNWIWALVSIPLFALLMYAFARSVIAWRTS